MASHRRFGSETMPFARRRRLALALIALSALVLIGLPLGLIGWYVGTARVVNAGPVIQAEVVRQTAREDLSIDYHVEVHGRLAAVDTSWLEGFQARPGSRIPVVLHPHDPGTVIAVGSHRPWQREPLVEVAAVGAGLLLAGSAAGVLTYHLVPETWERLSARLRRGLVRMTPPDGIRRLVAAAIPVLAVGICVLILWSARADHLRRAELVENSVPLRPQVLQTNDSRFKGQTYTEYLVDTPTGPRFLHFWDDPGLAVGDSVSVVLDAQEPDGALFADPDLWETAAEAQPEELAPLLVVLMGAAGWLAQRILPRQDWVRIGRIGRRWDEPEQDIEG